MAECRAKCFWCANGRPASGAAKSIRFQPHRCRIAFRARPKSVPASSVSGPGADERVWLTGAHFVSCLLRFVFHLSLSTRPLRLAGWLSLSLAGLGDESRQLRGDCGSSADGCATSSLATVCRVRLAPAMRLPKLSCAPLAGSAPCSSQSSCSCEDLTGVANARFGRSVW